MLLTFCFTIIIMVVLCLLDNDQGPEHFPYVDGGTIMFILFTTALALLTLDLTDRLSKPRVIHLLMPFLSNIIAILAIWAPLLLFKAIFS